jgi:hypothetical protein
MIKTQGAQLYLTLNRVVTIAGEQAAAGNPTMARRLATTFERHSLRLRAVAGGKPAWMVRPPPATPATPRRPRTYSRDEDGSVTDLAFGSCAQCGRSYKLDNATKCPYCGCEDLV